MFRGHDKLVIILTPEYLSIAIVNHGKVVQAERVELDAAKWDESWTGGLHLYDQSLRQMLSRLGGIGKKWDADVFYTSPDSICRVDICEKNQAASIAEMIRGLKQTVGQSNPSVAECLYSDDQSTVALGAADSDSNLQKLYGWLNRCKVNTKQILPFSASVVHQAIGHTLRSPEDTVVLYLSGRSSVIGYCENGHPKLIRLVDIGFNMIADVYAHYLSESEDAESASQQRGGNQPVSALDCNGLLFEHGIPLGKDSDQQQYTKLMPSMSPVLQRICIEIKQTLRFASSINTAPSKLLVCGPGASIPNIAIALGQSLDLHVDVDSQSKDYEPSEFFGFGSDGWTAASDFELDMKLLPKAAVESLMRKDLGFAIKLGGIVAAVFIGGQFVYATSASRSVQATIAEQSGAIQNVENDQARRESIRAMAGSIGTAASLIDDTLGNQADWVSVLGSMPAEDHQAIQISEIQGLMNSNRPVMNLTGVIITDSDDMNPSQILSKYIRSLKSLDSVRSVEIGSTSRSMMDESHWGLNFVISVEMITTESDFSELTTLAVGLGE